MKKLLQWMASLFRRNEPFIGSTTHDDFRRPVVKTTPMELHRLWTTAPCEHGGPPFVVTVVGYNSLTQEVAFQRTDGDTSYVGSLPRSVFEKYYKIIEPAVYRP